MALEDDNNWDVQQRLIHGFSSSNNNRTPHTGIKHFVANKIRLRSQATYFDLHPCVLIIPVLTLNQVKGWNGEGYSAVILVGNSSDINVMQVSTQIGLTMPVTEPGEIAERAEIGTARDLLESFLCGLASSFDDNTPLGMTDDQRRAWEALATPYRTRMPKEVIVPLLNSEDQYHRVRKLTFQAHSAGIGHPSPDPMLVVAKAAEVWSRRQDQPLLAGGLVGDEDDRSSLSVLAEEQWFEQRQESLRPQTWEDLARGLHQENGYQESIGTM
jgi:hypothetical protein